MGAWHHPVGLQGPGTGPSSAPGSGEGFAHPAPPQRWQLPTGPSFRCHTHLACANSWRLIRASHRDEPANSFGAGKWTQHRAAAPCEPPPAPCLSFPAAGSAQGGRRELPRGCGAARGGSHGHGLAPHHPQGWILPSSPHTSPQTAATLGAGAAPCPGAGAPTDGDVPGARPLSEQQHGPADGGGAAAAGPGPGPWPRPGERRALGMRPLLLGSHLGQRPLPQAPAPAFNFQLDLLHSHGNGMQMATGS